MGKWIQGEKLVPMARILRFGGMVAIVAIQAACTAEDGSPFPSAFERRDADNFKFVAQGNWEYPANTKAGETERLTWLNNYILQHQICPSGYDIITRASEHVLMSAKRSVEDQMERSIIYFGKCKSPTPS